MFNSIVILCVVLEFLQAEQLNLDGSNSNHNSDGDHGHLGHLGYPSSGISSGYHSYLKDAGSRSNRSDGESNAYPSSAGSHSYASGGWSNAYPSTAGSHSYPSSGGSHPYPSSAGRYSFTPYPLHSYPKPVTNIHHHYNPPQQIHFSAPHGGQLVSYPVYRGILPTYVYQYKDSGSKYSSLLVGLALFNLGTLAEGTVGSNVSTNHNNVELNYRTQPGEICLFGIENGNGDLEECRIDCQLMSSFIYTAQKKQQQQISEQSTITNITIIDTNNAQENYSYVMSPNATLTTPSVKSNGSSTTDESMIASKIVNAIDIKGSPIELKPEMQCYVARKSPSSTVKNVLFCGLLQAYSDQSLSIRSGSNGESTIVQTSWSSSRGAYNYPLSWGGLPGGTLEYLNHGSHYSFSPRHYGCVTDGRRHHGRGGRRYPSSRYYSGVDRQRLGSWYEQRSRDYQICVPQMYCYNPPKQIHYASVSDGPAINYPVYRGPLPMYVYKYKDSGSKYSTLLAGLALFDLGVIINVVCNDSTETMLPTKKYRPQLNEYCVFGIKEPNEDYEETMVECLELITGFMYAEQIKAHNQNNSSTVSSTTVQNETKTDVRPFYVLSTFDFPEASVLGGSNTPAVTSVTNTSNATIVPPGSDSSNATSGEQLFPKFANATNVKGTPINITTEMECYIKRKILSSTVMEIKFPCGVLQAYVDESLKPISDFDVNGTTTKSLDKLTNGGNSANSYLYPSNGGLGGSHNYPTSRG